MAFRPILLFPIVACLASACDDGAPVQAGPVDTGPIAGVASVVDGDTIDIHGKEIRLSGYDTLERGARCNGVNVYQESAFALSDFVGDRTVTCGVTGTDRWHRLVATYSVDGTDLGDYMVSEGWGRDWQQYSHGRYADEEASARSAHAGIWGLDCPADLWGSRTYD